MKTTHNQQCYTVYYVENLLQFNHVGAHIFLEKTVHFVSWYKV